MTKKLWAMLILFTAFAGILHAVEDEPSELNWESFGCNIDVFKDFQNYWKQNKSPETQNEVCPSSFPAVTVLPNAFTENSGNWAMAKANHQDVLKAKYGHTITKARAPLTIEEPGLYRVWVKYFHVTGYVGSFSLRILPNELLKQTDSAIVSTKGEYYSARFDWNELNSKRPQPLPNLKNLPTGFMWESGPMVELGPGEYTLELSTLVHGGPFTNRQVAAVVLTADPLLEGIDEVVGKTSFPASDQIQQHWNSWIQRPGAYAWENLSAEQRPYYLKWRNDFMKKLATNPANDAEKRLASQSYFDETLNLIGTPADIIAEQDRLTKELKSDVANSFGVTFEAENLKDLNNWKIKNVNDASGKAILEASYADGVASASTEVVIPKATTYYVWVRYNLLHKYFGVFDISFTDENGNMFKTKNFGDPKDRLKRGNGRFTWECLAVELPAGKFVMSLNKNIGKAPYTFRRVDKIFVTDNQAVSPNTFHTKVSDNSSTLWIQNDKWGSFSRYSSPVKEDTIEPTKIELQISQGDTESLLLQFRNDTTEAITLLPQLEGANAPLVRLCAYMNTVLHSWTPVVLLERSLITAPAGQNASLWLTFSTKSLKEGVYNSTLTLANRKIDFAVTVTPANNKKAVPVVGGWCHPLERESSWALFKDIGINLIFSVAVSKEEMSKYDLKHFCISSPNFQAEDFVKREKDFNAIGLNETDWSAFLIDEPTASDLNKWIDLAKTVRSATPKVQIWCNTGEAQRCNPTLVRAMSPYIDAFCPFVDHFTSQDDKYRTEELPNIGKLKLLYTTPCFREKSPESPKELLQLGELATKYNREGWAAFSFFCQYTYSNSIWDEVHPFNNCQSISYYPGAYGRTLSTRNLEAVRESIQRYRKN